MQNNPCMLIYADIVRLHVSDIAKFIGKCDNQNEIVYILIMVRKSFLFLKCYKRRDGLNEEFESV